MKIHKLLAILAAPLFAWFFISAAQGATLPTLSSCSSFAASDIFLARHGADTSDCKATGTQLITLLIEDAINNSTTTKAPTENAVFDALALKLDVSSAYTDEMAQDAIGAMVNTSLTYTDGTPLLALTSRTIGGVAFDGTGNIVPQTIQMVDAAGDTTTFPLLATSATGSLQPATDTGLSYNATTDALTATTFIGALTGNASTATALLNARTIGGTSFDGTANIVPSLITMVDSTDATSFPLIADSATGDLQPKTDGGLTYNASTANLSATTFTGALSGNATTATDLAANGTNCTVGNYPLGIDAHGNAESCTALGAGSVSWDGIGDAAGTGTVDFAGFDQDITSSEDGGDILTIIDTDVDQASDSIILRLGTNDTNDANTIFVRGTTDDDGTPITDWNVANTGTSGGLTQTWGATGLSVITDGDGAVTFKSLSSGSAEDLNLNLDDVSNEWTFTSSTGVTQANFGTIDLLSDALTLSSTGVISMGAGDSTITDGTDQLAFASAGAGYTFANGPIIINDTASRTLGNAVAGNFQQFGTTAATATHVVGLFNTTDATPPEIQLYKSGDASLGTATVVASGEGLGKIGFYGAQQTGTLATVNPAAAISAFADGTVTSGAGGDMPGRLVFSTTADGSGSLTDRLILDSAGVLKPNANDGVALGTTALSFSDLFLASGAVLNIANGDWVMTHTSGVETVGTGDLRVTTAGTNSASVVTVGGTQTLTNKTLTSPTLTTPSAFTTGGTITLAENTSIALDPAGSADGKYTGITVTATAGYAQTYGDLVYLDPTDSRWEKVDANSAQGADGDARGIIGIVVVAGAADGNACTILLQGIIRADAAFPTFTVNNPVYASETAGAVTQTQPTTTDVVIRVIGFGITADEMYFNPSQDYITHT